MGISKKDLERLQKAYDGTGYFCTKVWRKNEYLFGKVGESGKHLRLYSFESAMDVEGNIKAFEECYKKEMQHHLETSKKWGIYEQAKALFNAGKSIKEVRTELHDQIPDEYKYCTMTHDVLKAVSMESELL
jgi:hypothetical protein